MSKYDCLVRPFSVRLVQTWLVRGAISHSENNSRVLITVFAVFHAIAAALFGLAFIDTALGRRRQPRHNSSRHRERERKRQTESQ